LNPNFFNALIVPGSLIGINGVPSARGLHIFSVNIGPQDGSL